MARRKEGEKEERGGRCKREGGGEGRNGNTRRRRMEGRKCSPPGMCAPESRVAARHDTPTPIARPCSLAGFPR